MDDADLVAAVLNGDRTAFATIYDRYADRIHDFCWSVLRDREEAADAMQDTFVLAAERLGQLRDPSKLRAWLFAIARNEAIKRGKARQRTGPGAVEMADLPSAAAAPDDLASQEELGQMVWQAAAGLSERDRVLLDLHVRQGLEGQELADAIGVEASHGYVLLTRLRDQVERSLGALLVARQGRKDCTDLQAILAGWDGTFSPLIRKRVARHVDNCDVCAERRRTSVSPFALLGAIPMLPAPAEAREAVLDKVALVAHSGGASTGGKWDTKDGFPPSMYPRPRRRRLGVAVAAAAAAILVLAGLVVSQAWDDSSQSLEATGAGQVPPTTGESTPLPIAPGGPEDPGLLPADPILGPPAPGLGGIPGPGPIPGGPGPGGDLGPGSPDGPQQGGEPDGPVDSGGPDGTVAGSLAVSPVSVNLGASGTTVNVEVANTGGETLAWTATSSVGWLSAAPSAGQVEGGASTSMVIVLDRPAAPEGAITETVTVTAGADAVDVTVRAVVGRAPNVTATVSPGSLFQQGCQESVASVRATVSDESALQTVTLHWVGPNGSSGSTVMGGSGGVYTASVGPFSAGNPPQATWWVTATDVHGNTGSTPKAALPVGPCPQ